MVVSEVRKEVPVPEGVTVNVGDDGAVSVQGPNGTLERTFRHPQIKVTVEDGSVVVRSTLARRKVRALVGTWTAHLRNMTRGATQDYEYTLKTVYSHFPIKTKVQGETFVIENFLGEKTPRHARIAAGVQVKTAGEDVTVTGSDLEKVSQTAANIEQACVIRNYDTRVFQDGIYITRKGAEE